MSILKSISFTKIKDGLSKTREKLIGKINEAITGKAKIDLETLNEIEEILLSSDIGLDTVEIIVDKVKTSLKNENSRSEETVKKVIKSELSKILEAANTKIDQMSLSKFKPYVILIIGVNGAGKTTSIGKLAYNFRSEGYKVIIGSADTFRAAANDQLEIWARKAEVEIIQGKTGADPSSIVYNAIKTAIDQNYDIVLLDTAGRLHTKINLMQELKKMHTTINKLLPYAPNDVFIVLDATTGQNAIYQVNEFKKYSTPTGLIINKLDGTAKGGVIFQICRENKIPIRYIGVGEEIDDLQVFNPNEFVNALFE